MTLIVRESLNRERLTAPRRRETLFLLNGLDIGGSERKTVSAVNELHRRGWPLHLAYLDDRTALLTSLRDEVPRIWLRREGKLSLRSIRLLRDYVRTHRIGQIISVNLYPLIYAQFAAGSLRANSRPTVTLMANTTEHLNPRESALMMAYRPLLRFSERIVFGCEAQRRLWVQRYGLDASRSSVIYNGIDVTRFSQSAVPVQAIPGGECMSAQPGRIVIGTVGGMRPEKNQVELLEAFARLTEALPEAVLLLVGDGPERARLESRAVDLKLHEQVIFAGQLADVRAALRAMHIFVLPSKSETFSNAALEAMAMETPVVLGDTGGASEMVQSGIDGHIYTRGNINELASLLRALGDSKSLRDSLGRQARRTVVQRFSFDRMMQDYERILA